MIGRFAVVTLAFAGVACAFGPPPSLETLAHNVKAAAVKTPESDQDWAYICTVQVRNKGGKGKVRAKAKLFSPQGQFYREQEVEMANDEAKGLEFVFTEPTFAIDLLSLDKTTNCEFSYEVLR